MKQRMKELAIVFAGFAIIGIVLGSVDPLATSLERMLGYNVEVTK